MHVSVSSLLHGHLVKTLSFVFPEIRKNLLLDFANPTLRTTFTNVFLYTLFSGQRQQNIFSDLYSLDRKSIIVFRACEPTWKSVHSGMEDFSLRSKDVKTCLSLLFTLVSESQTECNEVSNLHLYVFLFYALLFFASLLFSFHRTIF